MQHCSESSLVKTEERLVPIPVYLANMLMFHKETFNIWGRVWVLALFAHHVFCSFFWWYNIKDEPFSDCLKLGNIARWKVRKPFVYLSEYSRQVFFFSLNSNSSAIHPLVWEHKLHFLTTETNSFLSVLPTRTCQTLLCLFVCLDGWLVFFSLVTWFLYFENSQIEKVFFPIHGTQWLCCLCGCCNILTRDGLLVA